MWTPLASTILCLRRRPHCKSSHKRLPCYSVLGDSMTAAWVHLVSNPTELVSCLCSAGDFCSVYNQTHKVKQASGRIFWWVLAIDFICLEWIVKVWVGYETGVWEFGEADELDCPGWYFLLCQVVSLSVKNWRNLTAETYGRSDHGLGKKQESLHHRH